jgi:hypothetical protein
LLILAALLLGWPQTILRLESLIAPDFQPVALVAYSGLLGLCLVGMFSAAFIPVAAGCRRCCCCSASGSARTARAGRTARS